MEVKFKPDNIYLRNKIKSYEVKFKPIFLIMN